MTVTIESSCASVKSVLRGVISITGTIRAFIHAFRYCSNVGIFFSTSDRVLIPLPVSNLKASISLDV